MADSPVTTNPVAQTFDNILSDVALNKILPIAEKLLEADAEIAFPILATPVIKQIFEGLTNEGLGLASKALLTALAQTGVKLIFTIQTEEEKSAYLTAEGHVRSALLSKDPLAIASAKKEMDDAADSIIFYDGSVNKHPE